jgi:DNA-binding NtrC family response regulator
MHHPDRRERILVVDDDPTVSVLVKGLLKSQNVTVDSAADLATGRMLGNTQRYDLILLDHHLPDGQGLSCLHELISHDRLRPVIYITAALESGPAIEAIKFGAFDYIAKPIDFEKLSQCLLSALQCRRLTSIPVVIDNRTDTDQEESQTMIGRCPAMLEVFKAIGRLAKLTVPVLIEGEVGTGKELVARAIYRHSDRSGAPFHKVCCSDLTPHRLHAELFGTVDSEGAPQHPGRISQFNHGTVLLENISSLGMDSQSRLMKLIQESNTGRHHNDEGAMTGQPTVRLIMTESGSLVEKVAKGEFRSDLYYQLRPHTIAVPPLRERGEDLQRLIVHFISQLVHVASIGDRAAPPRISPEAFEWLMEYHWPGNLDELQSVIRAALLQSKGVVLATPQLQQAVGRAAESVDSDEEGAGWDVSKFAQEAIQRKSSNLYADAITHLDRLLLKEVLSMTLGNQARAATILGITRTSLRRKIASLEINLHELATPND